MDSTLVKIIQSYERFQDELKNKGQDSLTEFVIFLNTQLVENVQNESKDGAESWKRLSRGTLEEMAASMIGKLGRFADFYAKKIIPNTELSSLDEFTYLISLVPDKSMTKTELIHSNIHAMPSGTEIIKRLIKKGFIAQQADESDKRSVRVSITPRGLQVLHEALHQVQMVSRIISGKLTNAELIQLIGIIRKLDVFHDEVFKHSKQMEMDKIVSVYLDENSGN